MITGRVTGDASMQLYIRSRGIVLRDELRRAVQEQGIRVLALVKAKLSGPVLKTRTGRLRRSVNMRFTETPTEISAAVGTNVDYARAHEHGFDGVVTVREHLRTITQAFGNPIAPTQVVVGAHPRHMRLPERSFLRSTLQEEGPSIREALTGAIRGVFA